jgi:hypothetical protein
MSPPLFPMKTTPTYKLKAISLFGLMVFFTSLCLRAGAENQSILPAGLNLHRCSGKNFSKSLLSESIQQRLNYQANHAQVISAYTSDPDDAGFKVLARDKTGSHVGFLKHLIGNDPSRIASSGLDLVYWVMKVMDLFVKVLKDNSVLPRSGLGDPYQDLCFSNFPIGIGALTLRADLKTAIAGHKAELLSRDCTLRFRCHTPNPLKLFA